MTSSAIPASSERVSTSGAWLGLGLAVRAALCVVSGFAALLASGVVPLLVDWVARNAEASEAPPELARLLDLLLDLVTILRPYSLVAGGAAIGIGLLMFVSAVAFIAGSDLGRRASRVLLVADVLHSIAASAWLVALWFGPLGEWNERYLKAVAALFEAAPGAKVRVPVDLHASTIMNLVSLAASLVFGVAIAGVLCWLSGRPFARRWSGDGAAGSAVASGADSR